MKRTDFRSATLFMVALLALCAFGCGVRSETGSDRAETSDKAAFQTRWNTAAAAITKERAFVEPWTEQAPYTMRVHLPAAVSPYEARKFANATRERLGEKAIVYVYDDTRKQLAKASPWGIE